VRVLDLSDVVQELADKAALAIVCKFVDLVLTNTFIVRFNLCYLIVFALAGHASAEQSAARITNRDGVIPSVGYQVISDRGDGWCSGKVILHRAIPAMIPCGDFATGLDLSARICDLFGHGLGQLWERPSIDSDEVAVSFHESHTTSLEAVWIGLGGWGY